MPLLLVRHGQIEANLEQRWHGSTDSALTAQGHAEARRVAAHIARARPQVVAVYTSPLQRASTTAGTIATALDVPLFQKPGLAEYGLGVLENETYADLTARHRLFELTDADLAWAPPGGESLGAVGSRVTAAWREIAQAHPDREVVVVGHGAAIAVGLSVLLHDDPRGWMRYHTRNASLTEIEVEPAPRLLAFDVVDHLD